MRGLSPHSLWDLSHRPKGSAGAAGARPSKVIDAAQAPDQAKAFFDSLKTKR